MSDTLHDDLGDGVRVLTVLDAQTGRWTTTIIGGPLDTWSTIYREDADPAVQHAKAIEAARRSGATGGATDAV